MNSCWILFPEFLLGIPTKTTSGKLFRGFQPKVFLVITPGISAEDYLRNGSGYPFAMDFCRFFYIPLWMPCRDFSKKILQEFLKLNSLGFLREFLLEYNLKI